MAGPIKHNGVILSLNADEPTSIAISRIADWVSQFSVRGDLRLQVSDIYAMLRTEARRIQEQEAEAEVPSHSGVKGMKWGVRKAEVGETEMEMELPGTHIGTNIVVESGATYITNHYYGKDEN